MPDTSGGLNTSTPQTTLQAVNRHGEAGRSSGCLFLIHCFKENVMQVSKIALAFAAGAALVAASASFAAVPPSADTATQAAAQAQTWTPTQQNANAKITRAQVRQELVNAEQNGQLDALRNLYRGS
jgi:hypothetical protein